MPKKLKYELKPLNLGDEAIGKRIARFRKEEGLTQSQLGKRIGITQTLVSDYEISRLHLSDEMVIRFALALEKSADEILGMKNLSSDYTPSLRYMKRVRELEKLPEHKQKKVLKHLDMIISASKQA